MGAVTHWNPLSEVVQGFALRETELLQVRLDSESAGCHEDNKADMGCEFKSDSVSVADRVSQNVDIL